MLYCTLTVQLIDQSIEAVKKHMQGKKFIRAKGKSNEYVVSMHSSSAFVNAIPHGNANAPATSLSQRLLLMHEWLLMGLGLSQPG
jgi:hypothetical protein